LKNNVYFFDNDDLLEDENKEKSKSLKNTATSRENNKGLSSYTDTSLGHAILITIALLYLSMPFVPFH
jgi:hypothetical protein